MITLKEAIERTLQAGTSRSHLAARRLRTRPPSSRTGAYDDDASMPPSLSDDADVVGKGEDTHPSIRVDAPLAMDEADGFSALELRDRVVIMLLFDQIVAEEDVAQVWNLWKQEYQGDLRTALWRLLTLIPGLDRELILEEAARVYGIEKATITHRAVVPIIKNLAAHLPTAVWERMVTLRLIPIGEVEARSGRRQQLVFASHDPTHPDVDALLKEMGVGVYALRYVPEHDIVDVLAAAFPRKYGRLKKVVDKERAQFADQSLKPKALPDPVMRKLEDEPAMPKEAVAKPNTSSIIGFVEELLVEAVRSGTSGMCLVPNKHGKTEVYMLQDQDLSKWRMIDHIDPGYLFSIIKSAIIRTEVTVGDNTPNQILDRWIDGKPYRIHIFVAPAGKTMDREAILFRVLA